MKTKTTFKTVLAMTLALILSVGIFTSAFAAGKDSITWTVYDETVSCNYLSVLEVGTNTAEIKEGGYYYFDISGLENGYYSVKITDSTFDYFSIPEKSGDEYIGWGDGEYIDDTDYIIFNHTDNTDVAVAGAYGSSESMKIELEYLGENIESISFGIGEYDEYIIGCDIVEYKYFSEDEYLAFFDVEITFTGGKTIKTDESTVFFTFDGELRKGENTANIEFAGYESKQIMNIAFISDYISDIKIDMPENATVYTYYNGMLDTTELDTEEVTVYFTDGTNKTFEYSSELPVILPGGREILLVSDYDYCTDPAEAFLTVSAGNVEIERFELNAEKASLRGNLSQYVNSIRFEAEFLKNRFSLIVDVLRNGEFAYLFQAFKYVISDISYSLDYIADETGEFLKFIF